ncbi:sensor histidine kinase [Streptomyces sp. 7-21]|uniref:sensor histidine kinase n=1 Tax=Streptomyces sp. 7-21 TaxID=2802283 RepID=UPI00191E1A7A|nr:sensor histidine kinase [Streptomyces sp. 7-21]MBL1066715.1 sensor histidine kinase [Streptomyces sp. 7-21]
MIARHGARARQWLKAHPRALDALLAAGAYAVLLIASVTPTQSPDSGPGFGERPLPAHTALLGALASALLMARRRHPLAVLAATCAITVTDLALSTSSHPPSERHASLAVTVAVALFSLASRSGPVTTRRAGLATLAVVTPAAMLLGQQPWYSSENLGVFAWIALAAALGEALRNGRAVMAAIRERAERAEQTREEEARRRVTEERMRIARELHDVVAHHISLVNVQAGVASHVMDSRPDQAKEALAHIRQASRRALSELQTTVGLLRQRDEPVAPTAPAGGLAVLGELVEGFTRTGMSVTVDVRTGGPLPSAVDLAAYRIVQEALTNVHKHAGPRATALVRVVRAGEAGERLDITVLDNGRAPGTGGPGSEPDSDPASDPDTSGHAEGGHGLVGMRERAAALGGTCEAGRTDGGGFRVRAVLPLDPPRTAAAPRQRNGRCCDTRGSG